jgi:cytochrome d ubiquinol oxidase subunit II
MMETFLPLFFAGTMGFALLIYVVLDGFDLGIGMLLPLADDREKDLMVASIGPFWDANETWIVLGVGILLIAFPAAYGIVLTSLYVPVTLMLLGLILRGIAFDFRVKAVSRQKRLWNHAFFAGSLLAGLSQGWMLGAYITGLDSTGPGLFFPALIAITFPALYIMLGSAWLLIKTEDGLQTRALHWAQLAVLPMGAALLLLSIATPLVSIVIAEKWFTLPNAIGLAPIPLLTSLIFAGLLWLLFRGSRLLCEHPWLGFSSLVLICLLAATGLAYSIYPDIIIGRLRIDEAAAATGSLLFVFWGVIITLPAILCYTVFVYRIFGGKTTELSYD